MIKVSVIVPVYNTANYLERCLDSLINQSLKEIEIIVVNDSSPDNAKEILENYKDKIKIINHNQNQGIGKSRNAGIKIANGEYIGFVDSDDYVDGDMYLDYYNYATKNNLDILSGHYYKDINNRLEIFNNPYFNISNLNNNVNLINLIDYGPCNKIFKRKMIKENNIWFEEKLKFEDMPFVLKALKHASDNGHINKAYYFYNVRSESETTTIDFRTKDIFSILDIINNYYEDNTAELEYLNIVQVTRYMLKQKYQKNKKERKKFIDFGFNYLNNNFPNWRKNKYYKEESPLKRVVKNSKMLLKLYCI